MAQTDGRPTDSNANDVQDMGMQRMPGQDPSPGQNAYTIRGGAIKAIVVHHAHLKKNPGSFSKKCDVCRGRVGPVLEAIPEAPPKEENTVVPGDGADEEGATTPTPDSGWPWDQRPRN